MHHDCYNRLLATPSGRSLLPCLSNAPTFFKLIDNTLLENSLGISSHLDLWLVLEQAMIEMDPKKADKYARATIKAIATNILSNAEELYIGISFPGSNSQHALSWSCLYKLWAFLIELSENFNNNINANAVDLLNLGAPELFSNYIATGEWYNAYKQLQPWVIFRIQDYALYLDMIDVIQDEESMY